LLPVPVLDAEAEPEALALAARMAFRRACAAADVSLLLLEVLMGAAIEVVPAVALMMEASEADGASRLRYLMVRDMMTPPYSWFGSVQMLRRLTAVLHLP
jgi:hypothetical protein